MIDELITALTQEVGMSTEEIADTIWLALQIQESESVAPISSLVKEDIGAIKNQTTPPKSQAQTPGSNETRKDRDSEAQKAKIYPQSQQQTESLDLSFKTPNAPSLRQPLTLARALKPLMRRIPGNQNPVVDEAATIERIANTRLWLPVLRPTLEPWLDLELVVDESISMQIWRQTIRDLEKLLENYGIFRDVRVWGMTAKDGEKIQVRRGIGAAAKNKFPRSSKELIDGSGCHLILVVSDCVSSYWRDGKVTKALEIWANSVPTAIIQMLPKWLWKRTALGRASEVRLRGLTPGVSNQNLIAQKVSLWEELEDKKGIKVPIFTLEEDKAKTWAQMLSGKSSVSTLGFVFKLDAPVKENKLFNLDYSQLSAEERVQAFRVTASLMARKLAGLLAAAPVISLPVVRLIRAALLPESIQVNVAEVFLGGLLKPLSEIKVETNPDEVLYGFMDGVRELLIDSMPSDRVLNVVDKVSEYMAERVGLSLEDFAAVLRKEKKVEDSGVVEEVGYFATVTAQVLRRLGGEYETVAQELELNSIVREKKSTRSLSTRETLRETFEHGYALLIGVGESAYPHFSLPVTVRDTQAIYNALVNPELCGYPQDQNHIRLLNNADATHQKILEGLEWLKEKATIDPEATALVYYSGHGWLDHKNNRYYLLPHDVRVTKLTQSALSAEVLTDALGKMPTKRLLVIIDASHSGKMATSKVPEEMIREVENLDTELSSEFESLKPAPPPENLFAQLKQGEEIAIFTSCRGEESSWVSPEPDGLSVYTHHLLEALYGVANKPGDREVRISDLMNHLSKAVPESVSKLYQKKQTPLFNMMIATENFPITKLRGGQGLPDVALLSERDIDYTQLRKLLIVQKWKEADEETAKLMFKIADRETEEWLRLEDIDKFPITDLQTIDKLWVEYSNGRFGFSVQKQIYQDLGGTKEFNQKITEAFWQKVGLVVNNKPYWSEYNNLTFDLSAPVGHLPIRYDLKTPSGVLGVVEGLLSHPGLVFQELESNQESIPPQKSINIEQFVTNLSQWANNIFDSSWQMIEDILGIKETELLFAVRSQSNPRAIKAKEINLGKQDNIRIVVDVMSISNNQRSIIVSVYPSQHKRYLPLGLKFDILDSSGEFLQQKTVNSRDKWMRQEITGKLKEKFSVKFQLGDSTVVNNFVI